MRQPWQNLTARAYDILISDDEIWAVDDPNWFEIGMLQNHGWVVRDGDVLLLTETGRVLRDELRAGRNR